MKYMCLIYGDEAAAQAAGPEGAETMLKAYMAYNEDVQGAGKFVSGEPLEGSGTATVVRVRGGETLTTDGPYAETKEQLGGFYILDCDDLDEAIAWAAKIPSAPFGSIEIRPVMKM